jgi:pilus assembly protein CpaF
MTRPQGSPGASPGPASPPSPAERQYLDSKKELHQRVIAGIDLAVMDTMSQDELRREIRQLAEGMFAQGGDLLDPGRREQLVDEVLDETFGLGPLEALMRDPTISDIMINGPDIAYVERNGRLESVDVAFHDERHLRQIVQRIAGRVGRRVDESSPMVDARLADGSRVNAVLPPLSLKGTVLSIRRFGSTPLLADDLIAHRAITGEMMVFLRACIRARVNVVISGGTGSGKTTLLNALSSFIPAEERVVTIEDAAELQLQQRHVVPMETRPRDFDGRGEVTSRDLVRNALRMRPDRIIIGECRGAETLDMLQAMNTGHDGSMTTIHANDTRDVLSRMEMMVGMAGFDLPIWVIRRQIASAVQVLVQTARLAGGARKVVKISEITGMEGDIISMHDIFAFKQTGVDANRAAQGHFYATGLRPQCTERLAVSGSVLPYSLFEQRRLG